MGGVFQIADFRIKIDRGIVRVPITRLPNYSITRSVLTINEIFYSIQGESTRAGKACVFVRLTACDLRCSWCDTPYAFHEGRKMTVDDVVDAVSAYGCDLVE